jgi:hypothetical protein
MNEDPFPVFYLTLKVYKTLLKTRPIMSCSGSLLYGLEVWLFQKIAQKQSSYFKSSLDLKQELIAMHLSPHVCLFIAKNAVLMYTNIPTQHALHKIAHYLRTPNTVKLAPMPSSTPSA